jgi:cytochrome c553
MSTHGVVITASIAVLLVSSISADDLKKHRVTEATAQKAATVCAACHGANGISVADHIPNLAGQRASYLSSQLAAFKQGARKSDIMNVMAATLSEDEMAQLATHFSSQSSAASQTKSSLLANVAATRANLPENYKTTFTRYLVDNVVEDKQVKHYYANQTAVNAARAGQRLPDRSVIVVEIYSAKLDERKNPVMGGDGFYVADQLRSYATMASGAGWGDQIPEALRNGSWNYAIFSPQRTLITQANQAECLACHLPAKESSYVFTLKAMQGAK